MFRFGQDYLHRVRSRAEDVHYFGHLPDAPQQVDRVALPQTNDEGMACGYLLSISDSRLSERLIVPFRPDETRAGGLAECQPEFHLRHRVHDGLVEVLHSLDEVALAENDVPVLRDF